MARASLLFVAMALVALQASRIEYASPDAYEMHTSVEAGSASEGLARAGAGEEPHKAAPLVLKPAPLLLELSLESSQEHQAQNGMLFAMQAEMQEMLVVHNVYRCMHGVPLMTWDQSLADSAQDWADNGVFDHSVRNPWTGSGENLAWAYSSGPAPSPSSRVTRWYDEIKDTNNGLADFTNMHGKAVGHYTQVVWRASVRLGCGKGRAVERGIEGDFWVCHYAAKGNIVGQFTTQVQGPTKTWAECCVDGGINDEPILYLYGTPTECWVWSSHCSISTVMNKCKQMCGCAAPATVTCVDGGINDEPILTLSGSRVGCSALKPYCSNSFVYYKCKQTCGC